VKSCEDQAKESGNSAKQQELTQYTKKITEDENNQENGLAYCMAKVQDEYKNPRFSGNHDHYEAQSYSDDKIREKGEGTSHKIYKSFIVPLDLDEKIPGNKSGYKYSKFGDWVGRVPEIETDAQYDACDFENIQPNKVGNTPGEIDIWFNPDHQSSACWTEMEPCANGDGYCGCEDTDSDTCGFFLLLEGETNKKQGSEPNYFMFVTYTKWENEPFDPISPCSSGMFHWENGKTCGCCVGPAPEGHYIFPTPIDISDRIDQGEDSLIYLTRKTYSTSADCGEKSSISNLADKNREFSAVERQFTHYRYETYKAICGSLSNTYDDCLANGCTPLTKKDGSKYTKNDWSHDDARCGPKCSDREDCNKNDAENGGLVCTDITVDEMCLGAACVWHIDTERCTGRVSFRNKDCTRNASNCSDTGGVDWGAQGMGADKDSSTTRRLDIPSIETLREMSVFGPEMRRIEVSKRELDFRRMQASIFDKICTPLTPKNDLRHCSIDAKDRIALVSMD